MQPQGLLGTMSTRNAPEQEQLPFLQRPEVQDLFDTLAIGFGGMTLNPNQALIQSAQERIGARREERQTTAQLNKTLEYFRREAATNPAAAQALRYAEATGDVSGALKMARGQESTKGVAVGDRLVNPVTGEVIYEPSGGAPDPKQVADLRKEFAGRDEVKAFIPIARQYSNIISSASAGTGPGDISLVFSYMKMLDPGSTVNQGEQASAQNAGGVPSTVRSLYNQLVGGGSLDDTLRDQFVTEASKIYENTKTPYERVAEQYSRFATGLGYDPAQIVLPSGYSGEEYIPRSAPPPPAGVDPAQWQQAWQNMTDEERRQFIQERQ